MFGQSDRQIADSNTEEGSIPQVLMLMNGEAQEVLQNPRSVVLATSLGTDHPDEQIQSALPQLSQPQSQRRRDDRGQAQLWQPD
jgi:hypothetical protein